MADGNTQQDAKDFIAPLPEQLRRQMAEAEQIRADMVGVSPDSQSVSPPPSEEVPASPPPADVPPQSQPPAEEESWEQRYRSLQGRLETERRASQAMADRVNHMESLIASMQAQGQEPRPADAQPKTKPKLVSEQEEADYGNELLTVVGKRAREEFAPEFEELAQRLQRLEGSVQGVGKIIDQNQTQTVYQGLDEHVPNWKMINKHDDFKSWLSQPDPFSGRRRQDMLKEAYDRHETGRVVAFFRGFLTEATGTPQNGSSPGNSAPPPANGSASGKPSLEEFAAPGRARSAPQDMPPDKPIYTSAFITKFMADKRTGKYRGREADADAIERDIYQAQHEGRISP